MRTGAGTKVKAETGVGAQEIARERVEVLLLSVASPGGPLTSSFLPPRRRLR